jgi:hypothetical protein
MADDLHAFLRRSAQALAGIEGLERPLLRRLADHLYLALQREYPAQRIYIPAPSRGARDRAILVGLASGDSREAVARRVGVHPSTVDRVRRRTRPSGPGMAPEEWAL